MNIFTKMIDSAKTPLELGLEYFYGIHGKPLNIARAHKYFVIAGKKGSPDAQKMLEFFEPGTAEFKAPTAEIFPFIRQMRFDMEAGDPQAHFMYGHTKLSDESTDYMFHQGLNSIKFAAERGHVRAMFLYGLVLYQGKRGHHDPETGIGYLKAAAAEGEPDAALVLFRENLADNDLVMAGLQKAVESGNTECEKKALCIMAEIHLSAGDGANTVKCLEAAAAKGDRDSMHYLGLVYQGGQLVERDLLKAAMWLKRAADLGDARAMALLGAQLLDQSPENPYNPNAAIEWLRKSLAAGENMAALWLGTVYKHGLGSVEQSWKKADELYRKAIDSEKEALAYFVLFKLYHDGVALTPNPGEAFKWLKKAAEHEVPAAMWFMGNYLLTGQFEDADEATAVNWYKYGAKLGDVNSIYEMGCRHLTGRGVLRNKSIGMQLLRSIAHVDRRARRLLERGAGS